MAEQSLLTSVMLAYTAGSFSLLSPCGVALIPGYLAHGVGTNSTVQKALAGSLLATLGMMTPLSVLGAIAGLLGRFFIQYVPTLQLVAGILIVGLGITLLADKALPSILAIRSLSRSSGLLGMYLVGFTYGLTITGCSAPIFLSILLYAFVGSPTEGVTILSSYALGMGTVFIVLGLVAAEARSLIARRIASKGRLIRMLAGLTLIGVGLYLFYLYNATIY